jgi:hypothetical protein
LAKCAYSQTYTDREPYSDINSHSDGDTERYADCHTNVYTAATPDSETAPHSTTSLTPARIGRTPWPPEIFAARREAFRVTNRRI